MLRKDEICHGIDDCKAKRTQLVRSPLPVFDDLTAVFLEVIGVFQRTQACRHTHAVDIKGICGKFQRVQVTDQCLAAHSKAQSAACHGAGFGQGLDHQQIIILFGQRYGAFPAEVYISLVNDHHIVGIALDDGLNI